MTFRYYPPDDTEPDDLPPQSGDSDMDGGNLVDDDEDDFIDDEDAGEDDDETPTRRQRAVMYRGTNNDPVFGYLIALALAVGLTPLIPVNTDLRYVIVWLVLAGFGVLAWLLGNTTRIAQETPENLAWGVSFGLIISLPLLLFGGSTLQITTQILFSVELNGVLTPLTPGVVLGLLLFAQPTGETLFFRGLLQETRPFWLVGLLSSLWSGLLFLPLLDIGAYPFVALLIGTTLVMMNMMYSYVRQRNGLAAAWLCQIVTNFVLLFLPFVGS